MSKISLCTEAVGFAVLSNIKTAVFCCLIVQHKDQGFCRFHSLKFQNFLRPLQMKFKTSIETNVQKKIVY